jgi:hypothetical protein
MSVPWGRYYGRRKYSRGSKVLKGRHYGISMKNNIVPPELLEDPTLYFLPYCRPYGTIFCLIFNIIQTLG